MRPDFLIPTGDDPENDDGDKPATKTETKAETELELKKRLLKEHNGDKEAAKKEYEDLMVKKLKVKFTQEGMEA